MFKKILVPIDGSKSSDKALNKAIKIGKEFQSEICVLSVTPEIYMMRGFTASVSSYDKKINQEVINMTMNTLNEAKKILEDYPYVYTTNYVVGDPAKEILNYAKDQEVNLIIMGNRGMGAFSRTILGSVSNKVVNASPISVLVVKDTE